MILLGLGDFRFPFPHVLTTEKVQLSKPFFRLRRAQSLVDNGGKLFGFIILDLGVDVHSYLAVFVPGKVLNCLRIDTRMDQVCDVGMAQKMRGHVKVQAVGDVIPVDAFLPRLRLELLFDGLPVDIPVERAFFGAAYLDIVPNTLKLRIGQRTAVAVSDDIF